MSNRTMLLACEDAGDADRFSAVFPEISDDGPCRIVLLHVVEKVLPVAVLGSLGGGMIVPPPPIEAERQWFETCTTQARRQLARVRSQLPSRCPVRLRIEFGPPAETICRVAAEELAAVVVLASHRRCRIRRWLLGRTTRRVVDAAPCNVLVLGPSAGSNRTRAHQSGSGFPAHWRAVKHSVLSFTDPSRLA